MSRRATGVATFALVWTSYLYEDGPARGPTSAGSVLLDPETTKRMEGRMSMPSEDQDRKTPPGEDSSRSDQGRRRGLDPEDETLLGKPVSRHDQMTQVAIAGFLGLLLVTFALAQSTYDVPVAPDPVPIDVLLPIEPVVVEEIVPPPPPPLVPEPVAPLALGNNRLYGTVVTRHGERFEGYIRWDRNEGSWADLLDASKRYTRARARGNGDRAGRSLRIRGVSHLVEKATICRAVSPRGSVSVTSGVSRF